MLKGLAFGHGKKDAIFKQHQLKAPPETVLLLQ
jgi:hypothetical protein